MDHYLIVVAQNQLTLCDYFRRTFLENPEVRVLLDRRWRERRQHAKEYETERRRGDRREAPRDEDLRAHGFVIVRPSQDGIGLTELETLLTELCQQVEIIAPRAIPADTAEGPSVPTSSRHRVAPIKGRGRPIHPSAPDEKLVEAAKRLALGDRSATCRPDSVEQAQRQEVLKRVGIAGLRLPDNGELCRPWQEFLQQELIQWLNETVKIRPVIAGERPDGGRYLLIVSRDQPDLFDDLTEDFSADLQVQVVLDQRRQERRRRVQGAERERRRSDRRRQPDGWTVKLSEFYRGQRPSFLPLAADPRPALHLRREDGSSFFGRRQGPGKGVELDRQAREAPAAGGQRSHTLGN